LVSDDLELIVRIVGAATALFGVIYAVLEKDTKRMLAFHTVSQLGFILAAPVVGGFYALSHGLVKSALFLMVGSLPDRRFPVLHDQKIHRWLWLPLAIASLSISGLPPLAGFAAKALTSKDFWPWQLVLMNIAAVGTAISFAKFLTLKPAPGPQAAPFTPDGGFWAAIALLLGGLVVSNGFYLEAYTTDSIVKALLTIGVGWLLYWTIGRRLVVKLSRVAEEFDHLLGAMGLTSILLFWMAASW
jgi:multicomponent Na+:H+ antiporter subunit D